MAGESAISASNTATRMSRPTERQQHGDENVAADRIAVVPEAREGHSRQDEGQDGENNVHGQHAQEVRRRKELVAVGDGRNQYEHQRQPGEAPAPARHPGGLPHGQDVGLRGHVSGIGG
jgi:hypothetical protein